MSVRVLFAFVADVLKSATVHSTDAFIVATDETSALADFDADATSSEILADDQVSVLFVKASLISGIVMMSFSFGLIQTAVFVLVG